MKRLRIFDMQTPLFWLTIFYHRKYGEPLFVLSVWEPNGPKWWMYLWKWEEWPDTQATRPASGDGQ